MHTSTAQLHARPYSHYRACRNAAAAAPGASAGKPRLYNARCDDCGQDYFVAFSCKGRGVCPSCNTRRMVETAAHLTDLVYPRLPVRKWVLLVPKRLRYFM